LSTANSNLPSPVWRQRAHPKLTFVLLVLLLLICGENVAQVFLALQQARELPQLATSLSPIYLAINSAWWAIAFAACIVGVIVMNRWAPWATIIVAVLYEVNLWINRLAFARSSEVFATLGFRALITLLFLGLIFALVVFGQLTYNRPHARPNT
jgi:uncharacterized membrane protein